MSQKEPSLQPAVRKKKCQICGAEYIYPEKNSLATRFYCAMCAPLSSDLKKILSRMTKRIQTLEAKLNAQSS